MNHSEKMIMQEKSFFYSLVILVVFEFVCIVNDMFEIVFPIVVNWFEINVRDVVNSTVRRLALGLVIVIVVDISWVEVVVVCKLDKLDG